MPEVNDVESLKADVDAGWNQGWAAINLEILYCSRTACEGRSEGQLIRHRTRNPASTGPEANPCSSQKREVPIG